VVFLRGAKPVVRAPGTTQPDELHRIGTELSRSVSEIRLNVIGKPLAYSPAAPIGGRRP